MSFPGGRFDSVRTLSLGIEAMLPHDFLQKIVNAFPCLEDLLMYDMYRPMNIEELSDDTSHVSEIITFPRLHYLGMDCTSTLFVKRFLFHRRTHLPRVSKLEVALNQLIEATDNFTGDEARVICSQVRILLLDECFVAPEHFHSYFPLL